MLRSNHNYVYVLYTHEGLQALHCRLLALTFWPKRHVVNLFDCAHVAYNAEADAEADADVAVVVVDSDVDVDVAC